MKNERVRCTKRHLVALPASLVRRTGGVKRLRSVPFKGQDCSSLLLFSANSGLTREFNCDGCTPQLALLRLGNNADGAPVPLDNVLCHPQAEPHSGAALGGEKRLENLIGIFSSDAGTIVCDNDLRGAFSITRNGLDSNRNDSSL